MKKWIIVVSMVSVLGAPLALAQDLTRGFSCLLNKSNSIDVLIEEKDGVAHKLVLETHDFLGRNLQRVVTLSRPRMQFIEYGNVILAVQDFGRSGYVLVRLERRGPEEYTGLIDVQLFLNPVMETGGEPLTLLCHGTRH